VRASSSDCESDIEHDDTDFGNDTNIDNDVDIDIDADHIDIDVGTDIDDNVDADIDVDHDHFAGDHKHVIIDQGAAQSHVSDHDHVVGYTRFSDVERDFFVLALSFVVVVVSWIVKFRGTCVLFERRRNLRLVRILDCACRSRCRTCERASVSARATVCVEAASTRTESCVGGKSS
jgi:hypothetical protein